MAAKDIKEDASWEIAKECVNTYVPVSSLFSASIRAIRSAASITQSNDPEVLKDFAIKVALFPVRVTPPFKVAFYFAARELGRLPTDKAVPITILDLLKLFSSDEIATIITLTYLHRIIKKRCEAEEWERLCKKMCVHIRLGAMTGEWIAQVGIGYGMLIGGLRFLSQAPFIVRDLKGYKTFRRSLEKNNVLFNLKEEEERWGCNHFQIGSLILGLFGFGLVARRGFAPYLNQRSDEASQEGSGNIEAEIRGWHNTIQCLEALHTTKPTDENADQASSLGRILAKLRPTVAPLVKSETGFQWILKRKEDLPAEVASSLEIVGEGAEENAAQAADAEVPDDLAEE